MVVWNRLSDRRIALIVRLHRQGFSYPQIAGRLKINRETVGRYIRKLKEPTRTLSVALYSSDLNKLNRQSEKQKKSIGDIVREITHEGLKRQWLTRKRRVAKRSKPLPTLALQALKLMAEKDNPIPIDRLASDLKASKETMHNTIKELRKRGFIVRMGRRNSLLGITQTGYMKVKPE